MFCFWLQEFNIVLNLYLKWPFRSNNTELNISCSYRASSSGKKSRRWKYFKSIYGLEALSPMAWVCRTGSVGNSTLETNSKNETASIKKSKELELESSSRQDVPGFERIRISKLGSRSRSMVSIDFLSTLGGYEKHSGSPLELVSNENSFVFPGKILKLNRIWIVKVYRYISSK